MKVRVVPALQLEREHLELWARLQAANPALRSPYFCHQFTRAVAAVRDDVFVAVVEDAGTTIGFLPFQRHRFGMGRPVGGALSDLHGMIALPVAELDVGKMARQCSLGTWAFDHLLACQGSFKRFHRKIELSPFMDLSAGYEAYARNRREAGSEQIKKVGNLRRRIEREVGRLRFVPHETDVGALRALMKWKTAQYLGSGATDVFTHRWPVALLEHLLDIQQSEFAGILSCLYINDRLIAAHMGMRSASVWHYWFPSYDEEVGRFSPGLILLLAMAEEAPRMGLTTIDLGKGDALYKQRLASGSTPVAEGCVEVAGWAPVLRCVRTHIEALAADPHLPGAARLPARLLRRIERWQRFR